MSCRSLALKLVLAASLAALPLVSHAQNAAPAPAAVQPAVPAASAPAATAPVAMPGIALHGEPKYAAGFTHFDYVNPDAPKGGTLHLYGIGTYDSLNPFQLTPIGAEGLDLTFETLMASSADEPFSQYGWVAESVTVAPDKSWVSYKLRPEAKFNDGTPITPEDVIFSFEILRDKGHPSFASYYKNVAKAEKIGPHEVKFTFKDNTIPELTTIMGQLPIMAKHDLAGKDFAASTLVPLVGSGPYKIESFEQGHSITYTRVKDWWAKDLPVNKGRYNFDTIHYDYYRDTTVTMEAFLAGRYDFRAENVAKNWALAYNTPAVQQGLIKKQEIKNELPSGMQAFILNLRRPMFQDRRVREALNLAFDFDWENKNFAYGAYKRTASYFENSELAAHGTPSPAELKLLEPWRGKIPDEVFTTEYMPPKTDGSGDDRDNLRKAADLLYQAGWNLQNGKLVNAQGQPFTFEIIESDPMFERWVQPYLRNLERLGINATFHVIDVAQYQNRMNDFDFDVTVSVFPEKLSPGGELYDYFSSKSADTKGGSNLIGIHDPAIDDLIDKVVHAKSMDDLLTSAHALDRVLQWNEFVIPHWHIGEYRIAYWDMFGQPAIAPKYGLAVVDSWWIDPAKAPRIIAAQHRDH